MSSLAGKQPRGVDDEVIFKQLEVMRSTLESMDDLVFVLDANFQFSDLFSYQSNSSGLKGIATTFNVGSHFSEAGFPDEVYFLFFEAFQKTQKHQQTERIRFSVKAFGSEFFYQAKLAPRFTLQNEFDGVTVVLRDISSSVRTEEKLKSSLEYYLTVLLNFPNPIWRVNASKEFDYFNNKWVDFTGIDVEKVSERGWKTGIHPHDQARVLEQFQKSFIGKKPFTIEYRLSHRSGAYRWVKNFCQPLFDHKNRFTGYMGSCFDIDDIRTTQQLLQESESRYRTMVQEQSDLIVRWKGQFSIVFANKSFCSFVGKPLESIVGENWLTLLESEKSKINQDELSQFIYKTKSSVFGTELLNKNKQSVIVQWLTSSISNQEGKVIEYQSSGRDITEILEKEKENQLLLLRLNEKVKELSLLNRVSRYINDEISEEQFFKYLANDISKSFLHPEGTFTQISYKGNYYRCDKFNLPGSYADISYSFGLDQEGSITVYRDKGILRSDHVDFIEKNEKVLLKTVCELTGSYLQKLDSERKLQQSETRYTELFESVPDIVFSIDDKGNILKINSAATTILGYSSFDGKNLLSLMAPTQRKEIMMVLHKTLSAQEHSFAFETKALSKTGDMVFLQVKGRIKYKQQGRPFEIFGVARDITEQKHLEQDIMKTVITTQERERKRFAEDLHDGIGPLLSGLKMYLMQDTLDKGLNEKQKRVLKYCRELVDDAIGQTRSIANNLTPGVLNDFGLEKALKSHVVKINTIGKFGVKLNLLTTLDEVNNEIALAVYRVITELINNTLKHADCKQVEITLDIKKSILSLVYTDDGKGFETLKSEQPEKGTHMGLKSIHNRIHSLDGSVAISSGAGKGVFVKIFIPLKS